MNQCNALLDRDRVAIILARFNMAITFARQGTWAELNSHFLAIETEKETIISQGMVRGLELLQLGIVETHGLYLGRYDHRTIADLRSLSSIYTLQGLQSAADNVQKELRELGRQQYFRGLRSQFQSSLQYQSIRLIDEIYSATWLRNDDLEPKDSLWESVLLNFIERLPPPFPVEYRCILHSCSFSSKHLEMALDHVRGHMNHRSRPYRCGGSYERGENETCSKRFRRQYDLQRHQRLALHKIYYQTKFTPPFDSLAAIQSLLKRVPQSVCF